MMISFRMTFLVSVLILIALVCMESQDFCLSYQKSNYSLIVFAQSYDTILLIVDRHVWKLKEKNSELVFDDFKTSYSGEDLVETQYDYAHPIFDGMKVQGIAFFKDLNISRNISNDYFGNKYMARRIRIDFYLFNDSYDKIDYKYSNIHNYSSDLNFKEMPPIVLTDFKTRVTYNYIQYRLIGSDNVQRYYTYKDRPYGTNIKDYKRPDLSIAPHLQLNQSITHKTNILFIGVYLNSTNDLIFFLRINNDIKYCSIYECIKKDYKVLISCIETNGSSFDTRLFVIIIMAIIVFVVIALIIGFAYSEYQKKYKSITIRKSSQALTEASKTVSSINTVESGLTKDSKLISQNSDKEKSLSDTKTVKTVDSVTGLPIDKSKNGKSMISQSISTLPESESSSANGKPVASQSVKPKLNVKDSTQNANRSLVNEKFAQESIRSKLDTKKGASKKMPPSKGPVKPMIQTKAKPPITKK